MIRSSIVSRFVGTLALCATIVLLVGCSSQPSDAEVEKQFRTAMLGQYLYTVEKFERVNGYKGPADAYMVEVAYDVVFNRNFVDVARSMQSSRDSPAESFASSMEIVSLDARFGKFKIGDRRRISETLKFVKTEKGWQLKG